MDKLTKAINKLSAKERVEIKKVLERIKNNSLSGFDLKKLKNRLDIYRVRRGKLRIIFQIKKSGEIMILTVEKRSDNTYNNY